MAKNHSFFFSLFCLVIFSWISFPIKERVFYPLLYQRFIFLKEEKKIYLLLVTMCRYYVSRHHNSTTGPKSLQGHNRFVRWEIQRQKHFSSCRWKTSIFFYWFLSQILHFPFFLWNGERETGSWILWSEEAFWFLKNFSSEWFILKVVGSMLF